MSRDTVPPIRPALIDVDLPADDNSPLMEGSAVLAVSPPINEYRAVVVYQAGQPVATMMFDGADFLVESKGVHTREMARAIRDALDVFTPQDDTADE